MYKKMNEALRELCGKYGVRQGEILCADGKTIVKCTECGRETVLLPWRVERRFTELKNFLNNGTLEQLSTLRFCSITAGGCLRQQLAKEFDLAAWMTEVPVKSAFAACSGKNAANVIAKLANDVNLSIECSTKLPAGQETIDRHELIAARGVASDRTVDTQVPQSSIYSYTTDGEARYTDTDAELFGFAYDEIWTIRAAFAVLAKPALSDVWNAAYETMYRCADAALASDEQKKVMYL